MSNTHDQILNYTITTFQILGSILKIISNSNVIYQMGFRQVYSLHLNIMDRDLAANCPVIHTILREQRVQVGWLLKLQSNMLGVASLLQCFPGTVTI